MKKKILTVITAITLLLGLTACADTRTALTVEGTEIMAGEYIRAQLQAAQTGADKMREADPELDIYVDGFDIFKTEIDGVPFGEWVQAEALNICRDRIVYAQLFDELGLSFNEEDERSLREYVDNLWESNDDLQYISSSHNTWGEFYEAKGVGKESTLRILRYQQMNSRNFYEYYGAEGIEPVSEESLKAKLSEDYMRLRVLYMSLYDDNTGEKIEDGQILTMLEEMSEDYARRLREGESIRALYDEYNAYRESLIIVEESEEDSEEPESDDDEAEENGEGAEPEEDQAEEDEEAEQSDDDYDFAETTESAGNLTEEMHEFVTAMNIGEVAIYTDEEAIYVTYKLDAAERGDWLEDIRDDLLVKMKGDEMRDKVRERALTLAYTVNDAAIRRYKPETIAVKELL